ncbi:hypothetical protein LXL04_011002 [Taraxacum kok-saghyz]
MAEKASKAMSLLKLAEERASLRKKLDEEKHKQQLDSVPYLPKDCVSNILIRLPLDSLQRSRFVCKPWYNIINSPTFVHDNLHRAEKVFIFLSPVYRISRRFDHDDQGPVFRENPNTFSVEAKIFDLKSVHPLHRPVIDSSSKYAIRYMIFADGKTTIHELNATCLGQIRTACDGLLVIDNKLKKGELVIMNPVTRQLDLLPLGTIYPPHDESFALVKCTNGYKLIHLFRDESQFIGCEVLRIGGKSWKVVDGPAFGLLKWFGYEPVSAIGALHWVSELDHSEYLVTMTIDDDKFQKIDLPKVSRFNDRIMEVSGCLCFVRHEEMNEISIWILEILLGKWKRIYTIGVGCIRDLVPIYFPKFKWEIYFMDKDSSVFSYDFQKKHMRKIEVKRGTFPVHKSVYMVHVNSLVSWSIMESNHDNFDV